MYVINPNTLYMKPYPVLFIMLFMISLSCAQQKHEEVSLSDETAVENRHTPAATAKTQLASTPRTDLYSNGRSVIKTVNYRFRVDNVKQSTSAIEAAIRKYPSYIASSSLNLEDPILENKITIRVQQEYFQDLLREIDQQAVFVHFRNVTTDDVSKDFVDLESRLKTKREVEARYMDILRKNAGTIEELLQAEQQIGSLHEEIEATISRINYLKDQVGYSTINLEFYQTVTTEVIAQEEEVFSEKITEAFSTGWTVIKEITVALVYLWPLMILAAAILLILKARKRIVVRRSPSLQE